MSELLRRRGRDRDAQQAERDPGSPRVAGMVGAAGAVRPPGRVARAAARLRAVPHRPWARLLFSLFAAMLIWVTWSMGQALTAPGNDSIAARIADWGRNNHLGPVVTLVETLQYDLNPPKIGGSPSIALRPAVPPGGAAAAHPAPRPAPAAPLPPRLSSPAGSTLPGEGTWQVLRTVRGRPAVLGAYLRPDAEHTSYVAAVASMNPSLLRFELHPGWSDPGTASWGVPYDVPAGDRNNLVATFNGGFKINEAGGGFYLGGTIRGTLTPGAASLVFYRDGHIVVGVWGRDVAMTPAVAAVRQNLRLVVDHGVVPASVDTNIESGWGLTIGGAYFVWRSGVGVTADGRVVFVYGPALSVRTLADLLQRAGCVEAMQLDINPAWMSFMYYRPPSGGADPVPVKLLDAQQRPADRYYTTTSRDFVAVFAR